jgi:hypothetical protein
MAGYSVYFVWPTTVLADNFASNRIDKQIGSVPYYRQLQDEAAALFAHSTKAVDKTRMKHIGRGTLFIVGSNAETTGIAEVADVVVVEEMDKCNPDTLDVVHSRTDDSPIAGHHEVSNPTFKDFGIDASFKKSTMGEWYIKCASCGEYQSPDWFHNVVREVDNGRFEMRAPDLPAHIDDLGYGVVCRKCDAPLERFGPGEWVHAHPARDTTGWHVSKLFSSRRTIGRLFKMFTEALADQTKLQIFHNFHLGLAYSAPGEKLDDDILRAAVRKHTRVTKLGTLCAGGCDVGSVLNVSICDKKGRVVYVDELGGRDKWKSLELVMRRFNCFMIIDADPETTKSREFCEKFPGRAFMCRFSLGRQIEDYKVDYYTLLTTVDRTQACDHMVSEILTGGITLPADIMSVRNYSAQMGAPTRRLETTGTLPRNVWDEDGKPDHYFMTSVYMALCLKIVGRHSRGSVAAG